MSGFVNASIPKWPEFDRIKGPLQHCVRGIWERFERVSTKAISAKSTVSPCTKRLADILEAFLEGWLVQALQEHVCYFRDGFPVPTMGSPLFLWLQQSSSAQGCPKGWWQHHLHLQSSKPKLGCHRLGLATFKVSSGIKTSANVICSHSKDVFIYPAALKRSSWAGENLEHAFVTFTS